MIEYEIHILVYPEVLIINKIILNSIRKTSHIQHAISVYVVKSTSISADGMDI